MNGYISEPAFRATDGVRSKYSIASKPVILGPSTVIVTGQVVDETGQPLAGAQLVTGFEAAVRTHNALEKPLLP